MRICTFCDRRANTLEDAWPKWLLSSIGQDSTSPSQYWNSDQKPPKTWPGPQFPIKCVCKDCNEGWMSRLETAVRPTLGSLLNDISLMLDSKSQCLLAAWACKTAMVFEGVKQAKDKFYSKEDRHMLREQQVPPRDTLIWLGRFSHSYLLHSEGRKLVPRKTIHGAPVEDGCATTFVIKRLAIQVLSIKRKPEAHGRDIKIDARGGPWNDKLIQVWPIGNSTVSWPPQQSFAEHDDSLEQFIRRFAVGVRFDAPVLS